MEAATTVRPSGSSMMSPGLCPTSRRMGSRSQVVVSITGMRAASWWRRTATQRPKRSRILIALRRHGRLVDEVAVLDAVLAQGGVVGADVDGLAARVPHDVEGVDLADSDLARVPGAVGVRGHGLGLGLDVGADGAGRRRLAGARGGRVRAQLGEGRRLAHGGLAAGDQHRHHRGDGGGDDERGARHGGRARRGRRARPCRSGTCGRPRG